MRVRHIGLIVVACALQMPGASAFALSVNTNDIVDRAVTSPKIAVGAVTTENVANGAITAAKLAPGLVGYAGLKVVHHGAADGVNTFNTVLSALDSIGDASPTNRYLIKLMPGVYDESVTLRPYIDLSGSGRGSTTLTSTSATGYTIKCADRSTIEGLTVTNAGSYGDRGTGTVLIDGVSATLRNVSIVMGGAMAGVMADKAGEVQILNSTIVREETTPLSEKGIFFRGTRLLVEGSRLTLASGNSASVEGLYVQMAEGAALPSEVEVSNSSIVVVATGDLIANAIRMEGTLAIRNSRIATATVGTASDDQEYVVQMFGGGTVQVANSTIEDASIRQKGGINAGDVRMANSSVDVYGAAVTGTTIRITNSNVSGFTSGVVKASGGWMTIGNSQIGGGHNGEVGTDKIVNCFDANFDPLANL